MHDLLQVATTLSPLATRQRLGLALCLALAWLVARPGLSGYQQSEEEGIRFTDVTSAARVDFRHSKGGNGSHFFPEQFVGGAAFLDYDGDGHLDIFFVQSGPLPGFDGPPASGDALYRNNGNGTFTDVTAQAGLEARRYGLGVASADYDNDGDPDIFVSSLEGNTLLRNDAGRFVDVTRTAGVNAPAMSTSAAFLDYDADGLLDLFVARYTDYSITADWRCIDPGSVETPVLVAEPRTAPLPADATLRLSYCGPPAYPGTTNRMYRNNGDGTFTDVTTRSGIAKGVAHGLGVAVSDFNDDGHIDIFVASDALPNLLFMNQADGTFSEEALVAGVAFGSMGKALAGMGVDAADYDNDSHIDLFITNYENEPNSLYRSMGDGLFEDESYRSGIAGMSLPLMGWGTRFIDLDLDGYLDLLVLNGHINDNLGKPEVGKRFSGFVNRPIRAREGYQQRAQVYRNEPTAGGRRLFSEASWTAGPYFRTKRAGRGAAFGDYDNDGDWDVVVVNNDEPAAVLRNDTQTSGRWAQIQLRGDRCNLDAIGAKVTIRTPGLTQTRYVTSGSSYLSDHDRRLLFGFDGSARASETVKAEIRWPCGAVQSVDLPLGRQTTVREASCRLATPHRH